jgi:excisionase family DNA binding protein
MTLVPQDSNTHANAPLALGILDAARAAGVGRSTIYENINAGHLKARKAGRRTLIFMSDLRAWLDTFPPVKPEAA